MSELLKIKLTIADRVYPLSVAPEQEEALRSSAKKIEAMIKQLEQNYAVRDKQDVLAMCALQFASKIEQGGIERSENAEAAMQRLFALGPQALHEELNEYAYDAESAGLSYHLAADQRGINLEVGGYNDKLPILLKTVLIEDRFIRISCNLRLQTTMRSTL